MAKTILITGASSGFGEACARKFSNPDYSLVLVARNINKLTQLATELGENCSVYVAKLDVTDAKAIGHFFSELPQKHQYIDILVNNAGLALGLEPAHKASINDWEKMVDTNIKGLIQVTRQVLPRMVAKNSGHIINIGSIAGTWPYPGGNVYGATKSFVQQFSRSLRADLLGTQIRVTNIDPGMAETNFSNVRMKGDENKAKKVYEGTKPLTASDIADIIYWTTSVPAHVNINTVEVMPTCQAWGPLSVDRSNV